ncbi:hypothetical protein Q9966_008288 [Columba livia]|nr:hypothetical protein Q9966_008288 [Columba livia]
MFHLRAEKCGMDLVLEVTPCLAQGLFTIAAGFDEIGCLGALARTVVCIGRHKKGGKGTVQMKELQPMASRSSVSTGDPACEKNCFRPLRTEKDQTRVNSACLHLGMQVDLAMLCPLAMPSTPGRHAQSSARHKNPHAMIVYEMLNFCQVRNKKMQQKCSPTLHHKPTVTLLCSRCDRGHYYVWPTMSV